MTFSHLEGPPALRVDIFKTKNSKYIKCQNDDEMEIVEDLKICAEPSQPLVKTRWHTLPKKPKPPTAFSVPNRNVLYLRET